MKNILIPLLLTIYILLLSLGLIFAVDHAFYNNWLGFLSISGIPALIIVSGLWGNLAEHRMSLKEWLISAGSICASIAGATVAVAFYAISLYGNGQMPPTVVAMMFVIFCVVVTMWTLLVFEGSFLTRYIRNPFALAFCQFLLIYTTATLLYPPLFDFEGFAGLTSETYSRLPNGLFDPWFIIVTFITSLAVIFAFGLYEQVPFGGPAGPLKQPAVGLVSLAVILAISFLIVSMVGILDFDLVNFMVRGPISFLFGLFILRDTGFVGLLDGTSRGLRGTVMTLASLVTGIILFLAYEKIQLWWAPALLSGAPAYQRELWLANAMLSVTFPMIIVIMAFLKGWPISIIAGRGK